MTEDLRPTAGDTIDGEATGEVVLQIPATSDDVRVARLVASGVATRAGFAIDDVEAARLVVDESCVLLLDACEPVPGTVRPDVLVLACAQQPGSMSVRVTRPAARRRDTPSRLTAQVLHALTDQCDVRLDADVPTVELTLDGRSAARDDHG